MNIELKQAAQQALKALENSQPHPSNPFIGLTKQDFIDHEETIRQLRNALQQPAGTLQARAQVHSEPIGEVGTMPGASGFTMACFRADEVPVGTKLYTTQQPAQATQPAEVTDGFVLVNRGTIESAMQHVPYRGEVWQELSAASHTLSKSHYQLVRAGLSLRPELMPMTDEQINLEAHNAGEQINLAVHTAGEGAWDDFRFRSSWHGGFLDGVRAAEAHHFGVIAKKEGA